jgi:hypothetical protein
LNGLAASAESDAERVHRGLSDSKKSLFWGDGISVSSIE